jgi:hypothetical protein
MSISYPPNTQTVGNDVPITVAYSATNVVAAPANALRAPEGLIINNATKPMYVTFTGAAATTASPSILVPANGGTLDVPGSYTGAINAIWVSGGAGNAVIHEFTYQ